MDLNGWKLALRFSHAKLDDDIKANVEACKKDMERVGIVKTNDTDPIIHKVIELYLKLKYIYMAEGAKFKQAYEELRDGLSLCGDYND